jgi:hypothetical protein
MNHKKVIVDGTLYGLLAIAACQFFFLTCQAPIDPPNKATDLAEYESVWQYCKAWSIYQDSSIYDGYIPADPFAFLGDSAEAIMLAIPDTLHGVHYTDYYVEPASSAKAGAQAATGSGSLAASLDSLTDSTALITIPTFEGTPYEDFLSFAAQAARFPYIVINLMNDKGGFIDEADSLVAAFCPAGTSYLQARARDYDDAAKKYVTIGYHPLTTQNGPLAGFAGKKYVVLMNGLTASASEILVAGLYEGTHALCIGSRSYGKGIGQIIRIRRDRKPLRITFLQLRGVSSRIGEYHHRGILPDLIPAAIQSEAALLPSEWEGIVFSAVKMLEPNRSRDAINYPADRTPSPYAKTMAGAYKVVTKDFVNVDDQ